MDNWPISVERNLIEAVRVAARQLGLDLDIVQLEPQLGTARADALIRVRYGEPFHTTETVRVDDVVAMDVSTF